MSRISLVLVAALACGCEQVDYIDIDPPLVILKQKNNEVWLRGRAMSHTGVHYSKLQLGWSSKDPTIATVDESGKVRPVKSGSTEIVARRGDIKASVPVNVLFAEKFKVEPNPVILEDGGPSRELKVTVWDHQGRELRDRTPFFNGSNPEVVSMGQDVAFPVAPGKAQVEVRVDDMVQVVEVVVEPAGKTARKK